MKYIIQSLYILAFLALGTGVSFLIGGIIPGSVLGMFFLFIALVLGFIKESNVEDISRLLMKNMVIFFLPATVGVMVAWDKVAANFWAIIVATVVSTVLVVVIVGVIQQKIGHKW